MPVNKKKSDLYLDQRLGAVDLILAARNGNKLDVTLADITTAAGDDATSTFLIGQFSPEAVMHEIELRHSAVTGATSVTLTAAGATKPLALNQDLSIAGTKDGMAGVLLADRKLVLWRMLGLAAKPPGNIDLMLLTNTNITAAGTVLVRTYHSSID